MLSQDIIHKKFTIPSISFADTVFRIRIRVAPKTYQNHEEEKNCPYKYYLPEEKNLKVYFLLHFGLYSKYSLYEKTLQNI